MPEAVGEWDVYLAFLAKANLIPAQVDALPAEFVEEALIRWQAEADHHNQPES